jgi:adenylate cyclase
MTSSRKQIGIRFTISGTFTLTVLLTSLLLGLATFLVTKKYIREDLRSRLHGIVSSATIAFEAEIHDRILSTEDEASADYQRLRRILYETRLRNDGIRFAYTFRMLPTDEIIFVVDSAEPGDDFSHVGDVYEDLTPTLSAAFKKPYKIRVEKEFATDKWGTWLSAYAPILREDGSISGLIGIDISAEKVIAYERRYLLIISITCLLAALLAIFVSLPISSNIAGPLVALSEDMIRIQRLDLNQEFPPSSKIREVSTMELAVTNMKKSLKSFSRYVPADLVRELIEMQKEAVIGTQRRDLTVMFTDIADFTGIAESTPPEQLVTNLGRYFAVLSRMILLNGGTVDKFIGDAVMAFWGAPRVMEQHALAACMSALAIDYELAILNKQLAQEQVPQFVTRIGISTGESLVGNIGFAERLSYTAIGDNVNLASRIEGLNKFYGTRILCAEATYKLVSQVIAARPVDRVVVSGKSQGVLIYQLFGLKNRLEPAVEQLLDLHTKAFYLYLQREWQTAEALLEGNLLAHPTDRPSTILLDRCRNYMTKPPPDDWTGDIYLREK